MQNGVTDALSRRVTNSIKINLTASHLTSVSSSYLVSSDLYISADLSRQNWSLFVSSRLVSPFLFSSHLSILLPRILLFVKCSSRFPAALNVILPVRLFVTRIFSLVSKLHLLVTRSIPFGYFVYAKNCTHCWHLSEQVSRRKEWCFWLLRECGSNHTIVKEW